MKEVHTKSAIALSRYRVMGILNVTDDSFSDGGKFIDPDNALRHALQMIADGAQIIDIGGESTRPGATIVGLQQEMDRVLPVLERLLSEADVRVSLDTSKAQLMTEGAKLGASMINDVRALTEPGALSAAAMAANDHGCEICLMHMQGDPQTMQNEPRYDNVVQEVKDFLQQRVDACLAAGVPGGQLLTDPGFGFGKTTQHNLMLLRDLRVIADMGYPVLAGLSRKRMFSEILQNPNSNEPWSGSRIQASASAAVLAASNGASVLRVHDVAETVQSLAVLEHMLSA